jgi:heat shock protein HslJ
MLNACKSDDAIGPNDNYITGLASRSSIYSKWKLVSYETNKKISYDVVLEFKNEKNEKGSNIVSGKSSINFYQADFVTENNKLKISNLIMTQIGGSSEAMKFEDDYLKRLVEVTNFNISDETLILSSTKQKMTFKLYN